MKKILCLFFTLSISIFLLGASSAIGSEVEEMDDKYVVFVDKYGITTAEFLKEINILHMSDRVGQSIKGDKRNFPKQDYSKFLSERIESKLILIESEKMGLDKEEAVAKKLDFKKLNMQLDRLRDEEINNKVVVTEEEILEYFIDQTIVERQEKKDASKSAKTHKNPEDSDKLEVEEVVELDAKARTELGAKMTIADYRAIKEGFVEMKTTERQKEYFGLLKKKARIKMYKRVIKKMSKDDISVADSTIVKVNGEKITARYVWVRMAKGSWKDVDKIKSAVDNIVMHRLLDQAAQKKGYEKEADFIETYNRYKEMILVSEFEKSIVAPLIKVSEKEIEAFYVQNKRYFKYPDKVKLSIIKVNKEDEALGLIEELDLGTEFSYLAKTQSLDNSRVNDGDLGWVNIDTYPGLDVKNVRSASPGSIAGPFRQGFAYIILELNGYKPGKVRPLDEVSKEIDVIIGKGKFEPTFNGYMDKLRNSISIRYNKKKLAEFGVDIK